MVNSAGRYFPFLQVAVDKSTLSVTPKYWNGQSSFRLSASGKRISAAMVSQKSFNIFSIRTIEEHTQKSLSDKYDRLLINSIRNLLISMNKTTLSTTLKDFISEKHQIFQRLAIYVMDRRYSEFKVIFWINFNNISEKINYGIKYEFYRLLTNNSTKFTSKQIDTVLSWIETITSSIKSNNNSEEESEKFNIHKRKEWLLPLKEHNKKAKKLYEEYHAIVPSEYEYPGLDFYISDFKIIKKSKFFN